MWFLLFASGAIVIGAFGLPAANRLAVPPPPEALLATYFLLAALLRLLVRDARLRHFELKAAELARRRSDHRGGSVLGELGLGVGRGALQAVGGDLIGAGLSLASALVRGATNSIHAAPPPRRERRRAAVWERIKATVCVLSIGLVCAAVSWAPLLRTRATRMASAVVTAVRTSR